jgi:hypothetical protein
MGETEGLYLLRNFLVMSCTNVPVTEMAGDAEDAHGESPVRRWCAGVPAADAEV